jgi:RecJ-like exonuclease
MGSGQIESLSKLNGNVIILDHHIPVVDSEIPLQINPNLFEISGTDEVCASSLAFLFAIVLSENNWDLAALALSGCIGDKQHMNGLKGINQKMVETAKQMGILVEKTGMKLDNGRLKNALVEGLDPFIKGISGREEKVLEFLKNLNLDPDIRTQDLNEAQKRFIASAIMIRLLNQGARHERAEDFILTKYWLPKWNLHATELSNYINSAGRMDEMGSGLALCLGDEKALKFAMELRKAYKDELRKGLLKLEADGPKRMDNIQFFYTENSSLAGAHCGLGMMYLFDQEKPTIALSVVDKETRISSRGTKYLTKKGLDLAVAMREAAQEVHGRGGGHPVASGASIPKGKEDAFLELLDYIVGKQLHAKNKDGENVH